MGKTALIVADMLNDFLDPQGALYVGAQAGRSFPSWPGRLHETRQQGGLVIFVCDAHAP